MGTHFRAPWGIRLKLATGALLALFVFVSATTGPPATWILLAVVVIAATFAVRGYSVVDDKLLVHRLGWSTTFDLAELEAAEYSPGATMGSIRTFGIGGLFGFIGRFRNSMLGNYRAYATDSDHTVVLRFRDATVVVTPDDPVGFVAALDAVSAPAAMGGAAGSPV